MLFGLLLFFISCSFSVSASLPPSSNPNCGPNSLMAICADFNIKTTIEIVRSLSWYDPEAGTTMLGLVRASNELKLPAVPLKLSYDELRKMNKPGIVFIRGNHFSVVWKLTKDKIIMQDWPDARKEISRKDFESTWGGEVIVYSRLHHWLKRKELESLYAPQPGPHIMFPIKGIDAGEVLEGEEISHVFTFVNIGSIPLLVSARSNCSCTAAVLSDKLIEPGQQGHIKVSFNTSGQSGPQKNSVIVMSNDPENKYVTLELSGTVKASVRVVPERLWIDRVTPASTVNKEFEVYAPGDTAFTITSIQTDSDIQVTKQKSIVDSISVTIPFSVTVKPNVPVGKYSKKITLISNRSNFTLEIPVEGEIVGPLDAMPPVIVFSGDSSTSIVKLISTTEHPPQISFNNIPGIDIKLLKINDKYWQLTAQFDPKNADTPSNGDIILSDTNTGKPLLTIPYLCMD